MSKRPFMPFYIGDYLGDTRHLTLEQHGAYLLLLMAMWNADGALPADDKMLARICTTTLRRWRSALAPAIMPFFENGGGEIVQRRLRDELERAQEVSERRAMAGRKGGRPKAEKSPETDQQTLLQESPSGHPKTEKRHENASKTSFQESLSGLFFESSEKTKPLKNNDTEKARLFSTRARDSTPTVTSKKGVSNETPKKAPPAPKKPAQAPSGDLVEFKAELKTDLDAERLDAIIKHRRSKRGQITGLSARLFRRDADACGLSLADAVDTCISRNWITVKPEFLAGRGAPLPRGHSPPRPARTMGDAFREDAERALREQHGGVRQDDGIRTIETSYTGGNGRRSGGSV